MIRHIRTALALFIASTALLANAQYTDRAAMNDLGGPKEFSARRTELAATLKTGYVLLFAKTQEPASDHYREDNVFDFAADLDHMTMDITRTFNIDGKFTPEQAKWYNVDLECQKAIIAMLKPGNTYEQAQAEGKKVFDRAGVGDQWYGWPGHFVGLATHDVMMAKGPILAGQVVTVEPIVEFPDKHWHFRVEDTILITPNGRGSPVVQCSQGDRRCREAGGNLARRRADKVNRRIRRCQEAVT